MSPSGLTEISNVVVSLFRVEIAKELFSFAYFCAFAHVISLAISPISCHQETDSFDSYVYVTSGDNWTH